jgi:hypothetical protein
MQDGASTDPPRPPWSALVLGLVLAAAGLVGLIQINTDPLLRGVDFGPDPGPAFVPRVLLYLLIAGGLGQLVIAAAAAYRGGGFAPDAEFAPRRLVVPALLLLSVTLYAVLLPSFGYLASTLIFALLWLPMIGLIDNSLPKSPLLSMALIIGEAVAIAGLLYLVFRYLILVPLP